jgi:hypothetical protein
MVVSNQEISNNYIENYFNDVMGQKTVLFNGKQYEFDSSIISGNAFFMDARQFVMGTVTYRGFRFENVPVIYDVFRDEIITKVDDDFTAFALINEWVLNFSLHNHNFIRIVVNFDSEIKTGFYDVIWDGKIKVLVKRTKSIQEKLDNTVQKYFLPSTSYFIEKDGKYYKINSESAFMSLFKSEKQLFRKKIKENKLNFRKNPEEVLVTLASYYNTLKN